MRPVSILGFSQLPPSTANVHGDEADMVLAAWGVHGTHRARDKEALALMAPAQDRLYALGLTRHGLPRHPLYVSYAQKPQHFAVNAG